MGESLFTEKKGSYVNFSGETYFLEKEKNRVFIKEIDQRIPQKLINLIFLNHLYPPKNVLKKFR